MTLNPQQLPDWLEAIVGEGATKSDLDAADLFGGAWRMNAAQKFGLTNLLAQHRRAALAEAAPKIGEHLASWQPIETAPKDGRDMLLAKYGWTVSMGDLEPSSPEWRARLFDDMAPREFRLFWMTKGHWSSEWDNWSDGQEPCGLAGPTNWMPLPADPPVCTVPPDGWACTRAPGHEGPCAAIRREVNRDE